MYQKTGEKNREIKRKWWENPQACACEDLPGGQQSPRNGSHKRLLTFNASETYMKQETKTFQEVLTCSADELNITA